MDRGCVVGREVQDDAGAAIGRGESPALKTLRQPPGVEDAHRERFTDRTFCDESPNRAVRPRPRQMVVGGKCHACALAGVDHLPRLFDRQRQWLLAETCLPAAATASACSW